MHTQSISMSASEARDVREANEANEANEAREASRKKGTPFCKVCFDAGNDNYATHYVKSLDGVLTCPTLRNQSCLRCGRTGHTSSYCQKQQQPQKQQQQQQQQQQHQQPQKQQYLASDVQTWSYNPKSNPFGMLEPESEEPQEQTMAEKLKAINVKPKSQFWWQDEDD
jgi:hypothetical protein